MEEDWEYSLALASRPLTKFVMSGKKKIHILGGPGSGKSYLARLVANELRYPVLDLDDIFWDNRDNSYDIISEPEKRDLALSNFLAQESWVVEGVYYRWLEDSFKQADHIVVLRPSVWLRDWRVLLRFLKRRMGVVPHKKKETFKGLWELLKWNHGYDADNLQRAVAFIRGIGKEPSYFTRPIDALRIIKT